MWHDNTKKRLEDGKFSLDSVVEWPGYIQHPDHPFGYCYNPFDKYINWSCTDSPQNFDKNKKTAPADWKYHTKNIEYHVNSSGFRTKEWKDLNWKESIVLLGDSCTYGVGLGEDETIAYHLEQLTGRNVINLGIPGSSNNSIVNNGSIIIDNSNIPYGVVVNWSAPNRFRYYYSNGYTDVSQSIFRKTPFGNNLELENTNLTNLWTNTYINPTNEMCLNYFLGKNSSSMWRDKSRYVSISFFPETAHYMRCDRYFKNSQTARDLIHPGAEDALAVANYLYEQLK
jgi:hypothetical protein